MLQGGLNMPTPVWQIERELEYAKARETYYRTRQPTTTTTVRQRKMQTLGYYPLLLKIGTTVPVIGVRVTEKSLAFFTQANLKLVNVTGTGAVAAIPEPKGFMPSMVHAMEGAATPAAKRAYNGTGRRYIKYSAATEGDAQAFYGAPISGGATPSVAEVQTAFDAIVTAKKATVGDYGRIWLTLERFTRSVS
jgi:hypothetical protein